MCSSGYHSSKITPKENTTGFCVSPSSDRTFLTVSESALDVSQADIPVSFAGGCFPGLASVTALLSSFLLSSVSDTVPHSYLTLPYLIFIICWFSVFDESPVGSSLYHAGLISYFYRYYSRVATPFCLCRKLDRNERMNRCPINASKDLSCRYVARISRNDRMFDFETLRCMAGYAPLAWPISGTAKSILETRKIKSGSPSLWPGYHRKVGQGETILCSRTMFAFVRYVRSCWTASIRIDRRVAANRPQASDPEGESNSDGRQTTMLCKPTRMGDHLQCYLRCVEIWVQRSNLLYVCVRESVTGQMPLTMDFTLCVSSF